MSGTTTIRIKDFDVSKVIFGAKQSPPKDSQYGIENVFVNYDTATTWPLVQFPEMVHPFDSFDSPYGGNGDDSIDMMLSLTSDC